jgi:hypothetical protein
MKASCHFANSLKPLCSIFALALGWLAVAAAAWATDPVLPPTITNINVTNGQVSLTWANGVPAYLVQRCAGLGLPWENVGAPTNVTAVSFPQNSEQAYFRVVSDFTARYFVTFNAIWSQATHPSNWPATRISPASSVVCITARCISTAPVKRRAKASD